MSKLAKLVEENVEWWVVKADAYPGEVSYYSLAMILTSCYGILSDADAANIRESIWDLFGVALIVVGEDEISDAAVRMPKGSVAALRKEAFEFRRAAVLKEIKDRLHE